jgi:four helix bundle protein
MHHAKCKAGDSRKYGGSCKAEGDWFQNRSISIGSLYEYPGFVQSAEIAERAFNFACRIVLLYEQLLQKGGAARALAGQLLDSGTSIGANLEEAAAGQTKADFIAKVCIARKEARETVYWLRLLAKVPSVSPEDVMSELNEAEQLVAILGSIVFNARSSSRRG